MKQEKLQYIIEELTRLDAELLEGNIAHGPNGELLTITDDEGWVRDDSALAAYNNTLFTKLEELVPDEMERRKIIMQTIVDSEQRAEYEALYIKNPPYENEPHLAHLRRVLGPEETGDFVAACRELADLYGGEYADDGR